jgi:hypothetical protein
VQSSFCFQMLREQFPQNYLFGKILGPDHQRLLPRRAASGEGNGGKDSHEKKPRRECAVAVVEAPFRAAGFDFHCVHG